MAPYRSAKELLPVPLHKGEMPQPVILGVLKAMEHARAEGAVVVISDDKSEMVAVLGTQKPTTTPLSFVVQPSPRGLPHAICCAAPLLADAHVLFAMPDTIISPHDALSQVRAAYESHAVDVMLGVFPTSEPERLGPIELGPDGKVLHIHDKPGHRQFCNTWGMACWSPRFTQFCVEWEAHSQDARERVLGHVFEEARADGLKVAALMFHSGEFLDVGTPLGLAHAWREGSLP